MSSPERPRRVVSNWRSVRRLEFATRERLQRRHRLWLHGWCIGIAVVALMWAASHLQMVLGSHSLALRYVATLGAGYLGFLLMLRWWAGRLVGEGGQGGDIGDLPDPTDLFHGNAPPSLPSVDVPPLHAGGGGDFGGGGASGSFDLPGDTSSSVADVASGALDVAGSADEGAVVVVPVLVVFLAGCLVLFGVGSLLLLYFGSEVLLAVAVELAFGYVSARTAVRVVQEGWLSTAVRLTWKPLLGAVICAVALGALVDHFVPQARSLPHAVKMLRGR